MDKICVNCVKEIKDKEMMCLSCHEKVLELSKKKIEILEKALKLCVIDKCYFENCYFDELLDLDGCKVKVPKKEQWYLEQAQKKKDEE